MTPAEMRAEFLRLKALRDAANNARGLYTPYEQYRDGTNAFQAAAHDAMRLLEQVVADQRNAPKMWAVVAPYEGKEIVLPMYVGGFQTVKDRVMEKAREEGFTGTIDERLTELGWRIVECALVEVQP